MKTKCPICNGTLEATVRPNWDRDSWLKYDVELKAVELSHIMEEPKLVPSDEALIEKLNPKAGLYLEQFVLASKINELVDAINKIRGLL